jgi:hypothetical protein
VALAPYLREQWATHLEEAEGRLGSPRALASSELSLLTQGVSLKRRGGTGSGHKLKLFCTKNLLYLGYPMTSQSRGSQFEKGPVYLCFLLFLQHFRDR